MPMELHAREIAIRDRCISRFLVTDSSLRCFMVGTRIGGSAFGVRCESLRDSVPKPRVSSDELPWEIGGEGCRNHNGVVPLGRR